MKMKMMKVWLFKILWVVAFFFLSLFNFSISSQSPPHSSTSLAKLSSSDLPASIVPSNRVFYDRYATVLVATLDGTISLVEIDSRRMEIDSGKILWSIKTGLPIYSTYRASQNLDLSLENASELEDDEDLNLFKSDTGIMEKLKSAKGLIRKTKRLSNNGTAVISQMTTTVFVVDVKTGAVIRTVRFSDSSGLGFEDGENPITISEDSKEHISITRTDYSFLAYSKISGKVLWNVTLAGFDVESLCLEVESSIVGNSGYKVDPGCIRHNIVYQIPDQTLPGIAVEREISGVQRALPSPESSNFVLPFPVKREISGAQRALPSPENSNFVLSSSMLALPSHEVEAADLRGSTMYPESSLAQFLWSPILSTLLLLLAVSYGVYRSVFVRENRRREDFNAKATTTKKKRLKKSGNNKSNSTANNNSNSSADDSGLSGRPHLEESNFTSLVNVQVDGRKIGKLFVSNNKIARGSNGTVVLEGIYDGRTVAVKRLVRTHHDVAVKEIQNLMASDQHPNIIRFFGVEFDSDFVYLSLERCLCSLADLIHLYSESSQNSMSTEVLHSNFIDGCAAQLSETIRSNKDIQLWKDNGYPSPQLLKLMRDVVSGVAHLHELGFIHRDLKPQNVLIIKDRVLCAKLSDMGISKRLVEDVSSLTQHATGIGSSGWRAPEQILHGRQTRAIDLFSLGCVLFFCMTGGKHPFGDVFERDANIVKNQKDLFLVEHVPEAVDLITHLLDPNPELRPKAMDVLDHPLFWNSEKRLSFLRDASDRVELEDREADSKLLRALEATAPVALGGKWDDKLESSFLTNISRYRRYKYDSVRDLLRVIRNKLNHYRELPTEIQEVLGSVPEGFNSYFTVRFPKLLIEVYGVIQTYCCQEELLGKYFKTSLL